MRGPLSLPALKDRASRGEMVSEDLVAHYPAGGQPVVTRRETEAASGESRAARKRKRPLEVPLKRAG